MSTFWKENKVEPKRKFRFKIIFAGPNATTSRAYWWAKDVQIPNFQQSPVEHSYLDNVYKFPGKIKWQNITMTMVDPSDPDATQIVMQLLEDSGYRVKESSQYDTISKKKAVTSGLTQLEIQVIDSAGTAVETWILNNPQLVDVNLDQFAYESDDLRNIQMTFAYDWATCKISKAGRSGVTNRTYNQ
tara:strand:+ start:113 stop:673 length:561 start_codon:yes stop_codon:yes gene_type:complete